MATVWLTYAWSDNENQDVDFFAQELQAAGLTVKLDRWNIEAGRRLWEQIESFICDSEGCDAWVMLATPSSLGSEPCKEEYAYALDRALKSRGDPFPIVALFPAPVDDSILPAGLRSRLCVSAADAAWVERIKAAAEGRPPEITRKVLEPFVFKLHPRSGPHNRLALEMRPRAGRWVKFVVGIPIGEAESVNPSLWFGPAGHVPTSGIFSHWGPKASPNGRWLISGSARHQATPIESFYLSCDSVPSEIFFGPLGGQLHYIRPDNV